MGFNFEFKLLKPMHFIFNHFLFCSFEFWIILNFLVFVWIIFCFLFIILWHEFFVHISILFYLFQNYNFMAKVHVSTWFSSQNNSRIIDVCKIRSHNLAFGHHVGELNSTTKLCSLKSPSFWNISASMYIFVLRVNGGILDEVHYKLFNSFHPWHNLDLH